MKYNKPFNEDDPEAVYVDGNPAVGLEGSVPCAAAVEYPQREVVDVIQYAYDHGYYDNTSVPCAAPVNTDLSQLRKAIFGMIRSVLPTDAHLDFYMLQEDAHRYVDPVIGDDSLYDGLAATIGSGHGPYKTIQRACQDLGNCYLNLHWFKIHCANGTYDLDDTLILPNPNGTGYPQIIGNSTTPGNCILNALQGSAVRTEDGIWYIEGFRVIANGTDKVGDPGNGVWSGLGMVNVKNMEWGTCKGAHMFSASGWFDIKGTQTIVGGAQQHMWIGAHAAIQCGDPDRPSLTISQAVTFSHCFVYAQLGGVFNCGAATLDQVAGHQAYASITGKANVTGKRFEAAGNGMIFANDPNPGSNNYFPGTVAGTTQVGGQYG